MEYTWQGLQTQLFQENIPHFITRMSAEQQNDFLQIFHTLPDTTLLTFGINETNFSKTDTIDCVIQHQHYWLVIRFVASNTPQASDWDILAQQARMLSSSDSMQQGQHIIGILLMPNKAPATSFHRLRAVSMDKLEHYIQSLQNTISQTDTLPIMPSMDETVPNFVLEENWEKQCQKLLQKMTSYLWVDNMEEATKIIAQIQSSGYALYITQDQNTAQQYLLQRAADCPITVSHKAYNLRELRTTDQSAQKSDFSFFGWGDDCRWVRKWKIHGSTSLEQKTIQDWYATQLTAGKLGVLIYIPSSADMIGTYNLLNTIGFSTLIH